MQLKKQPSTGVELKQLFTVVEFKNNHPLSASVA